MTQFEPGIHHIEFWVANLEESMLFYSKLFAIIGWRQLNKYAFSTGRTEIYFKEVDERIVRTLGPRHICYQAISRNVVDEVAKFVRSAEVVVIRGPIEMNHYAEGYYTIDFYDPNGFIVEVAYTLNVEI
ncbi:VOC family protein [Bacillus cytotoxicus]|uniref:Glyoxalase/bleomycin resistance protein/dioxygenase n=2 Tax=Bacillus cytotoxicus TaxID=580165 RepID=A0AAX2CHK1_9BACI|nr:MULTISPECIES: VOC family protein [Bacillus cereus group]ABS21946.1 Glyoxalase/bleomycin resistance protein/dioxygenase [Bacillus cytotoxicus NVH 391-98]AWC28555.1 hypothetical protein CG483_009335 [Bacillus cytotoxicus]AWC32576.1 hypothetical protein CG482_009140 [Bacillus cytotoxicus]AWC36605.1 hypothetical protein CG481_009150 [Bacillus cytotoxicus]AWC40062.1 hypothetical protein CG480_005920 [Bacillus cytotoxicus]